MKDRSPLSVALLDSPQMQQVLCVMVGITGLIFLFEDFCMMTVTNPQVYSLSPLPDGGCGGWWIRGLWAWEWRLPQSEPPRLMASASA